MVLNRKTGTHFDVYNTAMIHLMKCYVPLIAICCLAIACGKTKSSTQVLTPAQLQYKVDSIMLIKSQQLQARSNDDLRFRLKIEVKPKVDSIVRAANAADTML
jgi:hypothetical protein